VFKKSVGAEGLARGAQAQQRLAFVLQPLMNFQAQGRNVRAGLLLVVLTSCRKTPSAAPQDSTGVTPASPAASSDTIAPPTPPAAAPAAAASASPPAVPEATTADGHVRFTRSEAYVLGSHGRPKPLTGSISFGVKNQGPANRLRVEKLECFDDLEPPAPGGPAGAGPVRRTVRSMAFAGVGGEHAAGAATLALPAGAYRIVDVAFEPPCARRSPWSVRVVWRVGDESVELTW